MGAIEKVGLLAGFSLFSVLLHAREGRADGSTIFPMEEAGSRPAGPEQQGNMELPMRELVATRKGRAAYASSFPMEVARSRQSGPEWPGEYEVAHVGAGWPPGKGRADGCTLSWRRPAAVRRPGVSGE